MTRRRVGATDCSAALAVDRAAADHGLVVRFAHASVLGGVAQAAFIQTPSGKALLADLGGEPGLLLGLVTADGSFDGDVPAVLADDAPRRR